MGSPLREFYAARRQVPIECVGPDRLAWGFPAMPGDRIQRPYRFWVHRRPGLRSVAHNPLREQQDTTQRGVDTPETGLPTWHETQRVFGKGLLGNALARWDDLDYETRLDGSISYRSKYKPGKALRSKNRFRNDIGGVGTSRFRRVVNHQNPSVWGLFMYSRMLWLGFTVPLHYNSEDSAGDAASGLGTRCDIYL